MPSSAAAHATNPVAAVRRRMRNTSSHQMSVSAGSPSARTRRTLRERSGFTASRKLIVSALMIIRSRKFAVIQMISYLEPREQDEHDEGCKRQRRRDGGPTQHGKPEEVEQAPGEGEYELRHDADLAPEEEAERRKVQRRHHRQAQTRARDRRVGRGPTAPQKRKGGKHGGQPMPGNDPRA